MADYNVNMKQWNGTSFNNVLPLAYNAKQLGGKTYDEIWNIVKQYVDDADSMFPGMEIIRYSGSQTADKNTFYITNTKMFSKINPNVVMLISNGYNSDKSMAYEPFPNTILSKDFTEFKFGYDKSSYVTNKVNVSIFGKEVKITGREGSYSAQFAYDQQGINYMIIGIEI